MIDVRTAVEDDAPWIRDIIEASYREDYPYPEFYDVDALRRMILSDKELVLVAVDSELGRPVGTASVILEIGAYTDLVGEFGRLAVLPEYRNQGIGGLLVDERIDRVKDRLHVGLIEGRVRHPFTQRLARRHGFDVVGYLPLKIPFGPTRESMSVHVRYFGPALDLRRNHPRIVSDVYPLATCALDNISVRPDLIVDDDSPPYPPGTDYSLHELTTDGYADLLRIERGRVKNREIFGPLKLEYGAFQLQKADSRYLLARRGDLLVGGIGFRIDPHEGAARVFELIALQDNAIPFLLNAFVERAPAEWDAHYAEIDVSAYAPRMQRTLLSLGFAPAAYIPAGAFARVERVDLVRMARLFVPLKETVSLVSPTRELAEIVLNAFKRRDVEPRLEETLDRVHLFHGLSTADRRWMAAAFGYRVFDPSTIIFRQDDPSGEMYVLLEGRVAVSTEESQGLVGRVGPGECLGENALLTETPHSATAVAETRVEAATITGSDLDRLVARRPALGTMLYKNLARGLGDKLRRTTSGGTVSPAPEVGSGRRPPGTRARTRVED